MGSEIMYVDHELNALLVERGWLTIEDQLEPGLMEPWIAHSGVHDLQTLEQWVRMERGTYLRLAARVELGLTTVDDLRKEAIEARVIALHEIHANVRKVIKGQTE
jgi:hypothetical protein